MGRLSDLIARLNGQGASRPADSEPPKARTPSTSKHKGHAQPAPRKRAGSFQGAEAIRRSDQIPGHIAVLTTAGGEFEITERLQADYALLLVDSKNKTSILLISPERAEASGVDQTAMTLRQRCREKGYTVARRVATRDMLAIIYDEARRKQDDEKALRSAGLLEQKFDKLLQEALHYNASDIHIEVRRDTAKVRFRRNGRLAEGDVTTEWPVAEARSMVKVVYQVLAEDKDVVWKEHACQDASIDRTVDNTRVRVRLATLPTHPNGFDIVMRLLPMGQDVRTRNLTHLGYSVDQITQIDKALAKPVGVIIIAGTTGSGKSTSLVTMLTNRIDEFTGEIKVITVEDPPEYVIPGATQVPVIRGRGGEGSEQREFAAAIRAAMRCDPDLLMIGEVRDHASASLLKDAIQSGHQGFTTVHAPGAFSISGRLRSLGITNDILGSSDFLSALLYQTLVPTLCPSCAVAYEDFVQGSCDLPDKDHALLERLRATVSADALPGVRFRTRSGCADCERGIAGRTVVAEVVVPDVAMLDLIGEGLDLEAEAAYRIAGGKSLHDHGIEKLVAGLCDPDDLERKIGLLTFDKEKRASLERAAARRAAPRPNGVLPANVRALRPGAAHPPTTKT